VTITNRVSLKSVMAGVTPIADVPDAPTIGAATDVGTSRAYNNGSATVAYTAAPTGGAVTTFTATSTPGSFTGTGTSPITVTGLQSATSYTFTVTPTNSTATGPASSASSSITATTVPATPTIGTFTDGGTGTTGTLSFTAGATGGSTITNYSFSTDGSTYTALSPAQTTSPLSLTGLTPGTYNFSVRAINANGSSAASGNASGTVIQPTAFDSIATTTLSGTSSTISFSSIPSTYKSLQLRLMTRTNSSSFTQTIDVRFNSDTGANYANQNLYGNVATAAASVTTGQTSIAWAARGAAASSPSSVFGVTIIDIIDYANTSKTKRLRSIGGVQTNENFDPIIEIISGAWDSTAAISSITLSLASNNFVAGSTVALYGVKYLRTNCNYYFRQFFTNNYSL
jgi:trimeric autotransporter adhesin